MKKATRSGTSSVSVDKAKKGLEPHKFFCWINDFLKPRNTKSNVQVGDQESVGSHVSAVEDPEAELSDFDEYIADAEQAAGNDDDLQEEGETNKEEIEPPIKKRKQSKEQKGKSKQSKLPPVEEKQLHLMEEMEETF